MINRYSLIVFDWDGTLVDSVPNILQALKAAAVSQGLPLLDDQAYLGIIGMSLENAFNHLYSGLDPALVAPLVAAYKTHHRQLEQRPSQLFAGVAAGLARIQSSATMMAVATGKRRAGLHYSMAANDCEGYFHHCCTSDDAQSKPDPDMLLQILDALDVAPEQALMVGDSVHDMIMAARAGMDRVAVGYGAEKSAVLKAHQPTFVAEHFDEFMAWLGLSATALKMAGEGRP